MPGSIDEEEWGKVAMLSGCRQGGGIFFFNFIYIFIYLGVFMFVFMSTHGPGMEVTGQLVGFSSLLLSCGLRN